MKVLYYATLTLLALSNNNMCLSHVGDKDLKMDIIWGL